LRSSILASRNFQTGVKAKMHRTGLSSKLLIGATGLLALLQVLFSDFLITPFGGYADQRFLLSIISGLLIPVLLCSYARHIPASSSIAIKELFPTLLLSATFLLLSLPYHPQPYAWVEPGMYALFFLTIFLAGAILSWNDTGLGYVRYLVVIIAVACTFYGLTTINVYLFATFDGVTDLVDFIPWGFVNIRYWSHIATWCLPLIPLAVMVGPFKSHRLWQAFVLLGAGLWWWILFLTTGRGSALGIAFGVTLVMLLFGRKALPWFTVFLKCLAAGIVIWLMLSILIPSLMEGAIQIRSIKSDSSGRMPLFIEAWQMSQQNFPFGMGPQSWLTHETLTDAYATSKKLGHPHNMYLMWAAEYGWILLVALGLVVAQSIRHFWRRRNQLIATGSNEQLLILAGFTASVSAALFHAGVSAVFMAPGSMLVGMFVLIAFLALIIPGTDGSAMGDRVIASRGKRMTKAAIASMLFLIVWFGWMKEVVVYYQDMRLDEEGAYEQVGEGILPRFWFHGNFPR